MAKPTADKQSFSTNKLVKIPDHILPELLTDSEWRMLKNRWQIIQLLEEGLSIRQIAERVRVGTDTVVRVSRMLEGSSLQKMLDQEKKEAQKKKTPWVFGKNENE